MRKSPTTRENTGKEGDLREKKKTSINEELGLSVRTVEHSKIRECFCFQNGKLLQSAIRKEMKAAPMN